MKLEGIEIFAVGTWNGQEFTSEDVDDLIRGFKELSQSGRVPVKFGHTSDDTTPAEGWLTRVWRKGDKLLADIDDARPELAAEIKAGRWRHVSCELIGNVKRGGKAYRWLLDGLAILGSVNPAVDILKPLHESLTRSIPGLTFDSHFSFSRQLEAPADMSDSKSLVQENIRLKFNMAIQAGQIQPAERTRFFQRYGESATIADAELWISTAPKAPAHQRAAHTRAGEGAADVSGRTPDAALSTSVHKFMRDHEEKHYGKPGFKPLTYLEASDKVLADQPELYHRYRAWVRNEDAE